VREVLFPAPVPENIRRDKFCVRLGRRVCLDQLPLHIVGRVWRKLEREAAIATLLVSLWESATCWTLIVPDAIHFAKAVVDWV